MDNTFIFKHFIRVHFCLNQCVFVDEIFSTDGHKYLMDNTFILKCCGSKIY